MSDQDKKPTKEELDAIRKAKKDAAKLQKAEKSTKVKPWEQKKQETNDQKKNDNQNNDQKGGKKKKEKILRLKQEYKNPTPKGDKKILVELPKEYDPSMVEAAWYDWWVKKGFFKPEYYNDETREKFVIVIPPPNVTGSLHIGHALGFSIEDAICRYHRMNGKNVLWVPGTDHAGIATQSVVEKKLMREEKKKKEDLGRDKFVEKVWEWKNEKGDRIRDQLARLGFSLDWDRFSFTMDDVRYKAVTEAFVRFYDAGLIYRDNRLVNWSCKLRTAISDIECNDLELPKPKKLKVPGHPSEYTFGKLWEFAYKIVGEDNEIIVATTRPETMLGDTGVAIHPEDTRYKHLHGKFVQHPFIDRKIPIVLDPILVKMDFGSGAVKITPAHDPNDYECGRRHNLEFINILNIDGTLNENVGPDFSGLPRFEARIKVIKKLKELNLYRGEKDNPGMVLKICSRSGDVIEPYLTPQWYVNISTLAKQAADSLNSGELSIIPNKHHHVWHHYMNNPQPWCISRQLWWGHRCPAYRLVIDGKTLDSKDSDSWIVGRDINEAKERAKKKLGHEKFDLVQDDDVLDTWFSSGIFPFSVLGWPDNTSDLEKYYPNTLLETGHDILFFWVARMVMMGLQLTGKLPFTEVYLHSMVRDPFGEKMSKTKGNVIDPLDVIEGITLENLHNTVKNSNLDPEDLESAIEGQKKTFPRGIPECGTDALRMGLLSYLSQGRDVNLDVNKVEGYRNFCNKIWNAYKLSTDFLGDFKPGEDKLTSYECDIDKWIIHRLNNTLSEFHSAFKLYDFATATTLVHDFWWYDYCDVYLEIIKPIFYEKNSNEDTRNAIRNTMYYCLDNGFRILHPFMPFLSEELWQRIPKRHGEAESLCVAKFPQYNKERDFSTINIAFGRMQNMIKTIRSLQNTYNITKFKKPQITIDIKNDESAGDIINKFKDQIIILAYTGDIVIQKNIEPIKGCAVGIPEPSVIIYMHISGLIEKDKEISKLTTKINKTIKDISALKERMTQIDYQLVPDIQKEKNNEKLTSLEEEKINVENAIKVLKEMD